MDKNLHQTRRGNRNRLKLCKNKIKREIKKCEHKRWKSQNLDTGIRPREASRKWGGWGTKEMFGSKGESLGKSR